MWNHGSLRPANLGNLRGGEYSSASGINDAGEIAGAANIANAIVPFIWTPTAGLQRIPLLPGDSCGQASASIGMAMWLDILPARMAGKLSYGSEVRACAISAFFPAATTAVPVT